MVLRRLRFPLTLLALAHLGCKNPHDAAKPEPPEVLVATVIQRDTPLFVEFIGTLDGNVNAEIRARVPGIIEAQHYKEGSFVKAGDVLFTIDPKPLEASSTQVSGDLARAQASLSKANADVARLQPLVAKKAVSRQELDDALAAQASAKGQVITASGASQTARINLGYTKITSPINGIAGIAKVKIGNLVGQSDPTLLTTVSTVDPIRVSFSISERAYLLHAESLKRIPDVNAPGEGYLDLVLADGSTHVKKGKIALADRQVNPQTGTITIQALFPNPGNILRPGQFGRVRMESTVIAGALLVPQRAVQELQGTYQVAVVGEGSKVEIRPVKAGQRVASFWIIDQGLQPGETIIVEGLQKVRTGSVVRGKPAPLDLGPLDRLMDAGKEAFNDTPAPSASAVPSASAAPSASANQK
ncbi:MAG: efflux RND transporter periplasmic adaptor subunit [Myxococcales bacterium]